MRRVEAGDRSTVQEFQGLEFQHSWQVLVLVLVEYLPKDPYNSKSSGKRDREMRETLHLCERIGRNNRDAFREVPKVPLRIQGQLSQHPCQVIEGRFDRDIQRVLRTIRGFV